MIVDHGRVLWPGLQLSEFPISISLEIPAPMTECDIDHHIHCRICGGVSTRTRNLKGDETDRIIILPCRLKPIAGNVVPEAPPKNFITRAGEHSGEGDEEEQDERLHIGSGCLTNRA